MATTAGQVAPWAGDEFDRRKTWGPRQGFREVSLVTDARLAAGTGSEGTNLRAAARRARVGSAPVTSPHDDPTPAPDPSRRGPTPAPLTVAASLAGVEAIVFVLLGIVEVFFLDGARAVMGSTTAVFFLLYAAGLGVCALALSRLHSWARAPIVVAQLIQILVAWSFRGGATTWLAVLIALVAVLILVGIFHPASLDALAEDAEPDA